jgi:putative ABC transport system substrate-binding protein
VAWPLSARAQQPDRVRRIGVLMAYSGPTAESAVTAFRGALTRLGWVEGRNLRTEVRFGAGEADRIRSFAKELVDLRPDTIVGHSTPVVVALQRQVDGVVRELDIVHRQLSNRHDPARRPVSGANRKTFVHFET